jgi:hypothetical protein
MADLVDQPDPQVLLAAYNQALGRIGFDAAAQVALNQNGFGSMYNMLIYSRDHIKRMCKVLRERQLNPISINMEQEQLLTAMWHWVKARVRTNQDIDPHLFTREIAVTEAIKMVNTEDEAQETDSEMKLPDKFKVTSKWTVFSESVDTYLNRLKGQGRIPLNYVIRLQAEPDVGTVYATEQEFLVSTTPLEGDLYDLDNERVYAIVKQLILEGPGWAYITNVIDRTKDGRAAWLALRAHYEGESYMNKQKEDAYRLIEHLHYKGERATFTFEHFSGQLTKAYNDLQRYNEPILESKKVRDLLNKISDPKLESAKQAIRINSTYKNDFSMALNFLAESVDTQVGNKTRMISSMQQGGRGGHRPPHGRNNPRGGRGRSGRFTYRGRNTTHGGQGRGGRTGRGRSHGNDDFTSNTGGNNTYIPPSEWNAMTPNQRQTFLQARAAARISAITSALTPSGNDDISAISTGTNVPVQISQVSQASAQAHNANASTRSTSGDTLPAPFAGRAAHHRVG